METVLKKGMVVANYRIDGTLGRGGMGVVYEATQLSLNRTVALKILAAHLSDDPGFQERFRREGQLQAALNHPHIVTVFEAGESGHGLFLAMALVRGPNLKDLILSRALDARRSLGILGPVADALDTAHDASLIHRDIKPHNILVDQRDRPYLVDFGLTKGEGEASVTVTGQFVGTLDYISPEQIRGKPASSRSDVYALAAVLYECLTGVLPFPRDSEAAVLYAHLADPPPQVTKQRPDLPPALDHLFEKAMAKDPADRPSTATELLREAERALGDRTLADSSPPPPLKLAQEAGIRPAEGDVPTSEATAVPAEGPSPATHHAGATDAETGARTDPTSDTNAGDASAAGDTTTSDTLAYAGHVETSAGEPAVGGSEPTWPHAAVALEDARPDSGDPAKTETGRWRQRPRRMLLAAGLLVVAAGAAGTAVIFGALSAGGPGERGRAVTSTVQVGVGVDEVAVGKGSAWALNSQTNELSEIEPGADTPRGQPISVDEGAQQLAAGDEGVWLLDPDEATVSEVDPKTRQIRGADISVPAGVEDIAVGDGSLWLLSPASATVTRVKPESGELQGEPVQLPPEPERLAFGEGKVWIQFEDGTLGRLDPGAKEIDADRSDIGPNVDALAVGFESVWLASATDDTVSRAETGSGRRIGDPIRVGLDPVGLATGDDLVWVANSGDGTVTQIAP